MKFNCTNIGLCLIVSAISNNIVNEMEVHREPAQGNIITVERILDTKEPDVDTKKSFVEKYKEITNVLVTGTNLPYNT
ncbi:MAG: hypothetical protein WCT77_10050 [Bacteroidota bacterium]|jgi:hypothetical protein